MDILGRNGNSYNLRVYRTEIDLLLVSAQRLRGPRARAVTKLFQVWERLLGMNEPAISVDIMASLAVINAMEWVLSQKLQKTTLYTQACGLRDHLAAHLK